MRGRVAHDHLSGQSSIWAAHAHGIGNLSQQPDVRAGRQCSQNFLQIATTSSSNINNRSTNLNTCRLAGKKPALVLDPSRYPVASDIDRVSIVAN